MSRTKGLTENCFWKYANSLCTLHLERWNSILLPRWEHNDISQQINRISFLAVHRQSRIRYEINRIQTKIIFKMHCTIHKRTQKGDTKSIQSSYMCVTLARGDIIIIFCCFGWYAMRLFRWTWAGYTRKITFSIRKCDCNDNRELIRFRGCVFFRFASARWYLLKNKMAHIPEILKWFWCVIRSKRYTHVLYKCTETSSSAY